VWLEQNYRSHGNILDAANGGSRTTATGWEEPVTAAGAASDPRLRGRVGQRRGRWIVEEVQVARARRHAALAHGCSTARTRSRAFSSTRCFSRGCVPLYGGLRFSSARNQACARLLRWSLRPRTTTRAAVVNFPRADRRAHHRAAAGCASNRGISLFRRSMARRGRSRVDRRPAKETQNLPCRSGRSRGGTQRPERALQERAEGADRIENLADWEPAAAFTEEERQSESGEVVIR